MWYKAYYEYQTLNHPQPKSTKFTNAQEYTDLKIGLGGTKLILQTLVSQVLGCDAAM